MIARLLAAGTLLLAVSAPALAQGFGPPTGPGTAVPTSLPPSGAASGDLCGTYPGPTVCGIRGVGIAAAPSVTNQTLQYNGSGLVWTASPSFVGMNATSLGSATAVAYGLNSAKTGIYSGGQDASVGISVNGTLRADYAITTPSTWTLSGGLALGGCSIGSTVLCVTGTVQFNSGLIVGAGSAITSSGPGGALASGAFTAAFDPTAPGPIGGTTPGTGAFTTLNASTSVTINGGGAITSSGAGGALGIAAFVATGTSGATVPLLNGANTFSGNTTISSASFGLSGNFSAADWGTAGVRYANVASTITDTTSSGTVAAAYTDVFGGNTIAASSATTFTNYYAAYFKAPVAGTNVTMTNKYALGTDSLNVGGPLSGAYAIGLQLNSAAGGIGMASTNNVGIDLLNTATKEWGIYNIASGNAFEIYNYTLGGGTAAITVASASNNVTLSAALSSVSVTTTTGDITDGNVKSCSTALITDSNGKIGCHL